LIVNVIWEKEMRIKIPKSMMEAFSREPQIIIKEHPAGLWPVSPELLTKLDLMNKLISDKEFQEKFEIVIMPR